MRQSPRALALRRVSSKAGNLRLFASSDHPPNSPCSPLTQAILACTISRLNPPDIRKRFRAESNFHDLGLHPRDRSPAFPEVQKMNYHRHFGRQERPVETCLVGTGEFGRSYLGQVQKAKLLSARVAVDVSAERAGAALRAVGIDARDIALCETTAEARFGWADGNYIAAGDLATVINLPIDVVVEATGHPEAGARHALIAVEAGRHLALVSKEVDVVVGPGLSALARDHDRVMTPVDGDQPSLLMGLATWAEMLSFTMVAAGKSSEYDFVFDEKGGISPARPRPASAATGEGMVRR
jgi:hypothetical protein